MEIMKSEICLYSPSGNDARLLQFVGSIRQTDTRFLIMSDELGGTHLEGVVRNSGSIAHVFPRTRLASWSLAVASFLMREMREDSRKAIFDVDFAVAQKLPADRFLEAAAERDFYALSGRFDEADGRFAFASWECCVLSPALWQSEDFKTFLVNLAVGMNLDGRLYAERYFYEHFRRAFDVASVIDRQTSRSFDPLAEKEFSVAALLGGSRDRDGSVRP
jgi:hypothetical protein